MKVTKMKSCYAELGPPWNRNGSQNSSPCSESAVVTLIDRGILTLTHTSTLMSSSSWHTFSIQDNRFHLIDNFLRWKDDFSWNVFIVHSRHIALMNIGTEGTLSVWRNHYGSHFFAVFGPASTGGTLRHDCPMKSRVYTYTLHFATWDHGTMYE